MKLTNNTEPTFSTEGYRKNWKKAKERIAKHGQTTSHHEAEQKFVHLLRGTNVESMINIQNDKDRQIATDCLRHIFTTAIFLGKQGLAFRRNPDEEGNFVELLQLRAADSHSLGSWLKKYRSYTSHQVQNEILELISRELLRLVLLDVKAKNFYDIIADETSDSSCMEQLSFCLRHVNDDFETFEEFVGLYQLESCSAETIFNVLKDIVVRCDIKFDNCRGVSFDGAATMSGIKNGVAARVQLENPKTMYAYCHMHCLNLCVQDTVSDIPMIRDFMNNFLELTNFIRHSPKRMAQLRALNLLENTESSTQTLRPLCPTRMTVK